MVIFHSMAENIGCNCGDGLFQWLKAGGQGTQAAPPKNQQAENGKTEMSLMHFHVSPGLL